MSNTIVSNTYLFCSEDDEVYQHLPKSFQLMVKIEREAQDRVREILEDIEKGKATLEDVKKQWGLI